jgi:hypothetical protein
MNQKIRTLVTAALPALGLILGWSGPASLWPALAEDQESETKASAYRVSGPYTSANLSVFLIHGPNRIQGKNFLTLAEALEQKKAIVHETQSVNELAVENVSPDKEIFVQSGDIVKGGKQDRLLAYDLIVPPQSGNVPIVAFCVEAGRWQPRAGEKADQFDASLNALPTKELKLAAKSLSGQGQGAGISGQGQSNNASVGRTGNSLNARMRPEGQSAVWMEVAAFQRKLKMNLNSEVQANESKSSLELTLENKKVQEAAEKYFRELLPAIDGKSDVIGYAFAINGKLNSAEIYAAHSLFAKLWPRLLRASAMEALADQQKGSKVAPPTEEAVAKFLADAEKAKAVSQEVTKRVLLHVKETKPTLLFETRDLDQKRAWVHRSYLMK